MKARIRYGMLVMLCISAGATPAIPADHETGLSHFHAGRYAEAAAEFQALVDASPAYAFGHYMLGLSLLQTNDATAAVDSFKRALPLDPEVFKYRHGLAQAYNAAGSPALALETINAAGPLVTDLTRPYFHATRGLAHASLGAWDEAVADLEKAVEAGSGGTPALNRLALGYFKLERYDRAISALRRHLTLDPGHATTYRLLAESLMRAEKSREEKRSYYADALVAAETFFSMEPADTEALNLVGRAAMGAQDYPRALDCFRRVLERKPESCSAKLNLSHCAIALERWDVAEQVLLQADHCTPALMQVFESLGLAYRLQGRLEDALTAYEQAYEVTPSPSFRKAIDEIRHNIEVRDTNAAIDDHERDQREKQRELDREFDAMKKKVETWESRED